MTTVKKNSVINPREKVSISLPYSVMYPFTFDKVTKYIEVSKNIDIFKNGSYF